MEKQMLIFISGGVRSGKSSISEQIAIRYLHPEGRLLYIACGSRTDTEMDERIFHHRERRANSGYTWLTIEQSVDIADIYIEPNDTVLIDCVTTLLAGEYFRKDKRAFEAGARIADGILDIHKRAKTVVVVSNELSFETPATDLTADYMKMLGRIHQKVVKESNLAALVEHGIPVVKKGVMTCGGS
jgi:adenosylcobinamide kinase/adenosylcobinamide-phosphate guanylyltransferase